MLCKVIATCCDGLMKHAKCIASAECSVLKVPAVSSTDVKSELCCTALLQNSKYPHEVHTDNFVVRYLNDCTSSV
jgi:hypothetical protein